MNSQMPMTISTFSILNLLADPTMKLWLASHRAAVSGAWPKMAYWTQMMAMTITMKMKMMREKARIDLNTALLMTMNGMLWTLMRQTRVDTDIVSMEFAGHWHSSLMLLKHDCHPTADPKPGQDRTDECWNSDRPTSFAD
jgi:hypothetical protein